MFKIAFYFDHYLKCHDEMGEVKLCLQIKLKENVRLS